MLKLVADAGIEPVERLVAAPGYEPGDFDL